MQLLRRQHHNMVSAGAQLPEAAKVRLRACNTEIAVLQQFIDRQAAAAGRKPERLQLWDWDFYSTQVRKASYDYDEAEARPYFALNHVLQDGVFYAAHELYGITFHERTDLPVYHPDVRVFEVVDADNKPLAGTPPFTVARLNHRRCGVVIRAARIAAPVWVVLVLAVALVLVGASRERQSRCRGRQVALTAPLLRRFAGSGPGHHAHGTPGLLLRGGHGRRPHRGDPRWACSSSSSARSARTSVSSRSSRASAAASGCAARACGAAASVVSCADSSPVSSCA